MQAMSTQASSMPAPPIFAVIPRVPYDEVCPCCGTVVHHGYCGACDKTIEG